MKNLFLLLAICCVQGSVCYAQTAEMHVDISPSGKKVEPNQFGIFFEEINHAGGGRLCAELIRNGSFAEAPTLDAWLSVHSGSARVNLFFEAASPFANIGDNQ
jgi:hypothetical protein